MTRALESISFHAPQLFEGIADSLNTHRFCVWDSHGRQLYQSEQFGSAVTSVAWRPQGDMFLAAVHGRVLLCSAAGWLMSAHQHHAGSANVSWSHDGMCCGMACGNGAVMIGSVLGVAAECGSLQARHRHPRPLLKRCNSLLITCTAVPLRLTYEAA
jgi:hypothetical protein